MAASGDTRAATPGNAQGNRAISGSQVEVGPDGNVYLMRWTNPAVFYAISAGGEVVRRFVVYPGDSRYRPAAMHVYRNHIAVWFVQTEGDDGLMKIVDLEGHEGATFEEAKPDPKKPASRLGAAFACYNENPTRFLFVGATDDGRIELLAAEPR
jgi:hypothetical protein